MLSPLEFKLKHPLNISAQRRLRSFTESYSQQHVFFACHAVFPMALTCELAYSIWTNFQFDCKGHALNIPWVAVSDILLSGLFEESWDDLYQVNPAIRDKLIAKLELDPRFGPKRVRELAQFLLAYIQQQPKPLDIDAQDLISAQRRTALVYLEPNIVAHELALSLAQEYQRDESEVLRLVSQIETLSSPLQHANYESLLAYAWGMKELIGQEKTSNFNGLIQLDKSPKNIQSEFRKLLHNEPLYKFSTEEEQLLPNSSQSISKIISRARQEAQRLDHSFVNSEHLLLSILHHSDLFATKALNQQNIFLRDISRLLERDKLADYSIYHAKAREIFSFLHLKECPLSASSKRILAFSRHIANQLDHISINAEHLLLGILQDGENLASVLLENLAKNLEDFQNQIIQNIAQKSYCTFPIIEEKTNWETYSERAIKVLQSVKILSPKWPYKTSKYTILGSGFSNTEQILLELLKEKYIASIVATCTDSTIETVRIDAKEKANPKLSLFEGENVLTYRARKALSYAKEECLCLNHSRIDTYHLLLGCIREQDNAASTLLLHLKVNLRQLCTLLRNQATTEHHAGRSVAAIQVLTLLDIDFKVMRSKVHAQLQRLDDLESDTVGKGDKILADLGVNLCEVQSQVISHLETLHQFASDSNGKADQILKNLGLDLSEIRALLQLRMN